LSPIATAKQTASLLSLAGLAWVISHLPILPDNALYADLKRPAMAVLASAAIYLFLLGLQAFTHAPDSPSARRQDRGWAVVHGLVLLAVGATLFRGARSYALLAGQEGLVSVVAAVSAVALFVYGYSAWSIERNGIADEPRGEKLPSRWITCALQILACLPLLASIVYLECFPTEQAQQAQFHVGEEI
jgi:hypothetical protein